jgi:1-deoxy-D-xylulose-5-phosphate reductoisomerase
MIKKISILGSTGSIGVNTLKVIALHKQNYTVFALSAWNNITLLLQQIQEFKPQYAVVSNQTQADFLKNQLQQLPQSLHSTHILHGVDGLCYIAQHEQVDMVMAAIVGSAGLQPTFAAAKAGKRILLANKEALVMAGDVFMQTAYKYQAQILPIDSEHNAIYQCHTHHNISHSEHKEYNQKDNSIYQHFVKRIILTASGGPFLHTNLQDLKNITPEMACKHPKWKMGRKISVDSATMMNKGLEMIEAHWLFPHAQKNIDMVIHPQSIVHSLLEYVDGSILAQLSNPDMRIPIAYGLAYPQRIENGSQRLDISSLTQLNFMPIEHERFPCIELAYAALKDQQCITLNAANEIAVEAFLEKRIAFIDIYKVVSNVLSSYNYPPVKHIEDIFLIDKEAKAVARKYINSLVY